MNSKQIVIFSVVSIAILAGIFFISALSYFDGFSQLGNQGLVEVVEDDWEFSLSETDPLITPAGKIYRSLINQDDPVRGDENAEIVILEFGDFECPYCAQMHEDLLELLVEYAGEVKLVWKDFPNPSHLQARIAALAARCAGEQGSFWEYHDYLFTNQESFSRELYNQIALEMGLDLVEFNSCLDGQEYIQVVGQGLVDGQKLEVDATPYLFINNRRFDHALTYEELKAVIIGELSN